MNHCIFCMRPTNGTPTCPHCGKAQQVQTPPHFLLPGTLLAGRFLIGAALGEGGFGITYIGRDEKLDMRVAVKEYYPQMLAARNNQVSSKVFSTPTADDKTAFLRGKQRFLEEARTLAMFAGTPGVVDVRDLFEANGTAYIVMDYLDGQTLGAYLKKKGRLSGEEVQRLFLPVMETLRPIHREGLIHRDISPDNIMLCGDGIRLIDFGAARSTTAKENKTLSVILKPGYAPEEQYRGKGVQGPWTDIYALCATMYKCITGVTPSDSPDRVENDDLVPPSGLGIRISPTLERVILKGLSVRQRDRYQTVDEMLADLGRSAPAQDKQKTLSGDIRRSRIRQDSLDPLETEGVPDANGRAGTDGPPGQKQNIRQSSRGLGPAAAPYDAKLSVRTGVVSMLTILAALPPFILNLLQADDAVFFSALFLSMTGIPSIGLLTAILLHPKEFRQARRGNIYACIALLLATDLTVLDRLILVSSENDALSGTWHSAAFAGAFVLAGSAVLISLVLPVRCRKDKNAVRLALMPLHAILSMTASGWGAFAGYAIAERSDPTWKITIHTMVFAALIQICVVRALTDLVGGLRGSRARRS